MGWVTPSKTPWYINNTFIEGASNVCRMHVKDNVIWVLRFRLPILMFTTKYYWNIVKRIQFQDWLIESRNITGGIPLPFNVVRKVKRQQKSTSEAVNRTDDTMAKRKKWSTKHYTLRWRRVPAGIVNFNQTK